MNATYKDWLLSPIDIVPECGSIQRRRDGERGWVCELDAGHAGPHGAFVHTVHAEWWVNPEDGPVTWSAEDVAAAARLGVVIEGIEP